MSTSLAGQQAPAVLSVAPALRTQVRAQLCPIFMWVPEVLTRVHVLVQKHFTHQVVSLGPSAHQLARLSVH